ncbi:MAG: hypothetical protein OET63_08230, partial [Desulfobacterales bacterium]|nr:hypothetical protein [Desulfobacterales bacterium]
RLIPLACLECMRHDTVHKLKGMHHDFRALDRKKHDAGDLELDPMDQAMSGNSNLSLSESGSAATPKSDCQNLQTLVTQFFK